MDHLRSVLLDAQKLGLIPAGSSEVTERLRDVDAKDIRKLAKLVHGWQTKCVETQSKPFVEKSDWKAAGGAGDMLKAARERGLIRTRTADTVVQPLQQTAGEGGLGTTLAARTVLPTTTKGEDAPVAPSSPTERTDE